MPHLAWRHLYLPMPDWQCVVQHEAWGCHQYAFVQLDLRECQLSPACSHCWRIPWRGLPLWGRSLTSSGLAACRLKMPYAVLRGIPRRIEITGAPIPFPLRAITLQRCRIVYGAFSGQYDYQKYCMFCLVTHNVGSNLILKNQEVSGFSDQRALNAMVDSNEIYHKWLSTLLVWISKFSRNLKKSKVENFYIYKDVPLLLHRGVWSLVMCLVLMNQIGSWALKQYRSPILLKFLARCSRLVHLVTCMSTNAYKRVGVPCMM